MAPLSTLSTAACSAVLSCRWSSTSATATDVVTSTTKADAGVADHARKRAAVAATSVFTSVPLQHLPEHESKADRDRDRLQGVTLDEASGVRRPRLEGAARHALD